LAKAHDLSPSDRYFLEDIIQPGVQMNNGRVDMESLKNCEIKIELLDKYTIDQHLFTHKII
jgi:O-succinylbenzoate synthase